MMSFLDAPKIHNSFVSLFVATFVFAFKKVKKEIRSRANTDLLKNKSIGSDDMEE